jgi:hypothetical protein
MYSRGSSIAGQNVSFCSHWFRCSVQDILYGSVEHLINSSVDSQINDQMRSHATLLSELIMIRDGTMELSDPCNFTKTDIDSFLTALCTL